LETEAVLGGDASPADRLVVTGDTSGTTTVKVINVGGAGAQTTEGVKIVDVGGASNGLFSLAGDYVFHGQQAVIGGAYAYTLQKNGVSTPADGDWYLRSSLVNPPAALAAAPLYQPGVPLYENFARVIFGLNSMPTLQQRVGNRYWNGDAVTVPTANGATRTPEMFWARTEGLHTSIGSGTTTGSSYTSDQCKMRTGLDGVFLENGSGRLIGGVNVQYGTATAHINSASGNGHTNTMAYSVGGTLTWYGDIGFYVDGQGQATLFNSDLKSDLVARDMVGDNDSVGYGLSTEIGRRIGIGEAWTVTRRRNSSIRRWTSTSQTRSARRSR
jgi:fibronectin-binding autotransporter adhesin